MTPEIYKEIMTSNKQVIIGKSRQIGKSTAFYAWKKHIDIYNRVQSRKQTIKKLFNI